MGINTGILHNAEPLSTERIKELEKQVLENKSTFAYLDENGELCFSMPWGVDGIKDLAWHNAYELSIEGSTLTKKQYKKTGLKTFSLDKVLSKQNLGDSWAEDERLEGDGSEYYTLAPTPLSFRSTAPLNELQEIQINGVTVDPANYTLEEGSTIVTFPIDYLKTLNVGNYEVAVDSNSKTVKGDFSVKAPELNEYGFYYNQPYSAYVGALNTYLALILSNDGSMDILNKVGEYMSSKATYSINGNTIAINSNAFGALTATFSEDGKGLYCNEVATNFVLGDDYCVADGEYVYLYFESINGYGAFPLNKTKSSYNPIRMNINNILTKAITSHAFDGNTNLRNITITDGIVIIDFAAFYNCIGLRTVTIPDSVTSIGSSAFEGCSSLESVTIPDSVDSIGEGAFCDCSNLESIVISDSVTEINHLTFANCNSLINIEIPDSVKLIRNGAFSNCTNLEGVTIGSGVENIDHHVFENCTSLKNISFNGTIAQWKAVDKENNWYTSIPATHVHCIDGDVAL
jgi:hypothetical protein